MLSLSSSEYNSTRTSRVVRGFMNTQSHDEYKMASGVLLPSGKVRVGVVPPQKVSDSDREYEHTRARVEDDYFSFRDEDGYYKNYKLQRDVDCQPLGLSAVPNYHNSPRRHGLKGISSRGRETVKEAAYILERRYGRRMGFYTLTCPYTDVESIASYNQNISNILRSFFQEVKRVYERERERFSYVSVLEVQPHRFQERGEFALHVHYLAPCYKRVGHTFIITASEIRAIWARVCGNSVIPVVEAGASVDCQVVKKSCVGYIAKYLTKGGGELDFIAEHCPEQLPSQWWSTCRPLRKAVASITVKLPDAVAQYYLFGGGQCPEELLYLTYSREVFILWNDQPRKVGISGQLCKEGCRALQDWKGKLKDV